MGWEVETSKVIFTEMNIIERFYVQVKIIFIFVCAFMMIEITFMVMDNNA